MKMLSVSQYAKRCGETTRNIYNRLKTDLKDKAVKQDGKWFIMVDDETPTPPPTQEATPQPTPPREEDTETLLRQREKELAEKEKQLTEMLQEVIKLTNQAQILTREAQEAQKQVLNLTTTNAAQKERILYLEGELRKYQDRKPWYKRIFDKTKRDGK